MSKNWAITIGINQYDNLGLLKYAKPDAEAVRDFCVNEVGFEKVYYFSDDSPPIDDDDGKVNRTQPTYAVLSRFLRVLSKQPFLQPGDNLWFFFAGHGRRHQNRDYLMPSDVDPYDIEHTAISINQITERLRCCGADNVILILDACRNEGDRDGQGIGLEKQQGVITIFSCSPNERSYEIDELQHGSFTCALLQGLRIQGEGNCATVDRLNHYLHHRVSELNRQYNKLKQTPYIMVEPATKLHFILLPKQASMADVNILKKDALDAEIKDKRELAKQLWIRVLAASSGDLEAIEAIERIALKSNVSLPLTQPVFPATQTTPSRSSEDVSLSVTPLQDLSDKNLSNLEELVNEEQDVYEIESELKSRSEPNIRRQRKDSYDWLWDNKRALAEKAGKDALNNLSEESDNSIRQFYNEIEIYLTKICRALKRTTKQTKSLQILKEHSLPHSSIYVEALNAVKNKIPRRLEPVERKELEDLVKYLQDEIIQQS